MRVLIADDEEKICQLIKNLVNWEELGMHIIAFVNDGIAALDLIQREKPELVITDIRMPGCTGLELIQKAKSISPETEFIIISGYRHFEYAQNAIRYGVKNYLLKPIKKVELNEELEKIRKNYSMKAKSREDGIKTTMLMEQTKEKIRAGFLEDALFKNLLKTKKLSLSDINETYQFHFSQDVFQVIAVKIDGLDLNIQTETEYIQDKLNRLIDKTLVKSCADLEYIWTDNFCYVLLNYQTEQSKGIRHGLKNILDNLLLQKDILNTLFITIGIGNPADCIDDIFHSAKLARRAVEQRILDGPNRLIDASDTGSSQFPYSQMFEEFNKSLTRGIESLNENEIVYAIQNLQNDISSKREMNGYEVLQMAKEAMNLFLFTIRNRNTPDEADENYFDRFLRGLENQYSVTGVINYLKEQVLELFEKYKYICLSEENRPIREAKKYIRENYKNNISLTIVGEQIGFNGTYLSTLFKKEAGCTFSEYLIQVRMEKAKELLKETNDTVAAICEDVGYSDLKSFTKNFRAYTGLRPNEYRKIYS